MRTAIYSQLCLCFKKVNGDFKIRIPQIKDLLPKNPYINFLRITVSVYLNIAG